MSAAYERVKAIGAGYRRRRVSANAIVRLQQMAGTYLRRRTDSIVDAAAVAASVTLESLLDRPDPAVLEALRLQYPGIDPDSLASHSPEELGGVLGGVKGKYFEMLVRDRLNDGEWVGDLHLEPGQVAKLADSPTQQGWDLEIVDSHGQVVEDLQAKATASLKPIHDALVAHPDIDVITTSEAAEHFLDDPRVIDSGIDHDHLGATVSEGVADLAEGPVAEFCESAIPWVSLAVIAVTEGRRVLFRLPPATAALSRALFRAAKSTAGSTVAAALIAAKCPYLAIVAGPSVRLYLDRIRWHEVAAETIGHYRVWVSRLAPAADTAP